METVPLCGKDELQLDVERFRKAEGRDKSEEISQEFLCKLLPVLDRHKELKAEELIEIFSLLPQWLSTRDARGTSLLDFLLFDLFSSLIQFLDNSDARDSCAKIVEEVGNTCNPREALMVLGEGLAATHKAAPAKHLLGALQSVFSRLPEESKSKFMATSFPAVANLTIRRHSDWDEGENDDEDDEDDEAEEEEGEGKTSTEKESEKGKEKKDNIDEEDEEVPKKGPIQTSVQLRNAFGDTEEELEHKYSVSTEHLNLISGVLDFLVALIPKGQPFQHIVTNEVGRQQRLILKMLLHLLGEPLAQANFGDFDHAEPERNNRIRKQPNQYLQAAQRIAHVISEMGVPPTFVLEHKTGKALKIFGTKRAEKRKKKKARKRLRERKKKRAASRDPDEMSDDYDDEDDDDERPMRRKDDFYWSEMGLGCYSYLLFVVEEWHLPLVYSPIYTFFLSLPCISSLLRNPAPKASLKGLELANKLIQQVKLFVGKDTLSEQHMDDFNSDLSIVYRLLEDMITFMINCPDERIRQDAYKRLHECLSLLGDIPRFMVLGELIRKCPYPAITGLLITRLKDEVQRAWLLPRRSSPFASHKLLDLFPFFMSFQGDILEKTDVLMNSLNCYRFLLLRDRGKDVIGIWQPAILDVVKTEFMQPLRKELGEKLDEYIRTLSSEEQHKKIELMTKHGFPKLSPSQMDQASNATLTSLYMVKEIFDRVEELLKEEEEKQKALLSEPEPKEGQ